MENGKIFISYRREDTSGESGRLKDKLEQIFGKENIFYDVETLETGLNFDQSIAKALNESTVLLAMIGPHWMRVSDSKGTQRILKSDDWVRKEIAEALRRGIRVIPILVNGADMPDSEELPEELKELSLKHAQELSSSRWNYDVGELSKVLEKFIPKKPENKQESKERINPNSSFVPSKRKEKSWIAKNYLKVIGGTVAFFLVIILIDSIVNPKNQEIIPEETADSETEYSEQTEDSSNYNLSPEEISNIMLEGEWYLTEERNNDSSVTKIVFSKENEGIFFKGYLEEEEIGSGIVQIDNEKITLVYKSLEYDSTGRVSLDTPDDGITWKGTSSYTQNKTNYKSTLSKKSNP